MRSLDLLSFAATVSAGTVSVPISKFKFNPALTITKRGSFDLLAINNITGGGYYAEFEIGTPGQKLGFLLDTGSSDTWVNSVDSDLCNSQSLQMENGYCMTSFDPDKSSTFEMVDRNGFDITYLDNRNIEGDYFNDTVTIDGNAILNQQLGLATKSVRPTGIMGLGFKANVAATKEYPTVVDNMVSQGFIDTPAFSLYLNDLDSQSGSILFGGIDKTKFIGNLETLPLKSDFQSISNNITSFTVTIDGLSVKNPNGKSSFALTNMNADAILDSGSTISLLPQAQVQQIWDQFDIRTVSGVQIPFVDCAYGGAKGNGYSFDFQFAGKNISVPMDEMIVDAFSDIQEDIRNDPTLNRLFQGWEGACMFGIGSASEYDVHSSNFVLLGDTFLRSAYVVYDLANEQVGIAQANLNSTNSNIVDLKAGESNLPKEQGVDSKGSGQNVSNAVPPSHTSTGQTSSSGSNDNNNDDDDDNAGGHVTPALAVTLVVAIGAAMAVL